MGGGPFCAVLRTSYCTVPLRGSAGDQTTNYPSYRGGRLVQFCLNEIELEVFQGRGEHGPEKTDQHPIPLLQQCTSMYDQLFVLEVAGGPQEGA